MTCQHDLPLFDSEGYEVKTTGGGPCGQPLPCPYHDAPLVKGGQGRSAESVRADARALFFLAALAMVAVAAVVL